MSVRVVSTIPDFEECYVDVSEKWTRKEREAYLAANDEQTFDMIRNKVEACHLILTDGTFCNVPAEINEDVVNNMDVRLVGFLSGSLNAAYQHLSSLGFRSARPSSVGTEVTAKNGRP
jgi:hypothetical protein